MAEYLSGCDGKRHGPTQRNSGWDLTPSFEKVFTTKPRGAIVANRYCFVGPVMLVADVAVHTASLDCIDLDTGRVVVDVVAAEQLRKTFLQFRS